MTLFVGGWDTICRMLRLQFGTGSSRRRRFGVANVAAESLETRSLLTPTAFFDFTTIASNLSTTQRFFGSNNPAHAPYKVIRYGNGQLRPLRNFRILPVQVQRQVR